MNDDREAEIKEHLEAFNIFDQNKDQKLSKEEAKYAYMALGWNFTDDELNKIFLEHGRENLMDSFAFTSELEDLGQTEGENYIAIVHVDGNNMGERFAQNQGLNQYKNMSKQVRHKTWESFAFLLEEIIDSINENGL